MIEKFAGSDVFSSTILASPSETSNLRSFVDVSRIIAALGDGPCSG